MKKSDIIQAVKDYYNERVNSLDSSVQDMREDADLDESNTMDPEDLSHANESKDMEMRLKLQAINAKEILTRLETFGQDDKSVIEPGAVVKTSGPWFLVGVSAPKISIGKQEVYSLTEDAPAYAGMQGKKKGDTIKLGNNTYTIKDVL